MTETVKPLYNLYYWQARGRGEQIRLMLEDNDIPYVHKVVGRPWKESDAKAQDVSFTDVKSKPNFALFDSLPVIERVADGFSLVQTSAILGFLAKSHKLYPDSPEQGAVADSIVAGAEDLRIKYFGVFGKDTDAKMDDFVNTLWAERWGKNLEAILQHSGTGFFVGKSATHADYAMWDVLNSCCEFVKGFAIDKSKYPLLHQFYESFAKRPKLAAYLKSKRRAQG